MFICPAFIYVFYRPMSNESWCTLLAPYHSNPWHEPLTLVFVTLLISTIILNALALSSIVWRVKQNGRQLPEIERDEDQYVKKCIDEAQQYSKLVVKQSLAYIGAFILTLLFPILRMLYLVIITM